MAGSAIGEWIRTERQAQGWSLSALACRAGIAKATLSRWEAGLRQPSLPELEAVLSAMSLSPARRAEALARIEAPRAIHHLRESGEIAPPVGGDLLRAMRLRQGRTQSEIALQVGVSQATLAKWERADDWPSNERLHALCYALNAHSEEISVLTRGRVIFSERAERRLSLEEFRSHTASFRYAFDGQIEALRDLRYLALEAHLWPLAQSDKASHYQLTLTYAYHARSLAEQGRYSEADLYAANARDLAKEHYGLHTGWLDSVIARARSAAYGGRNRHPERGIALLKRWVDLVPTPATRGWMESEIAIYQAECGAKEAALTMAARACGTALQCNNAMELRFRKRDLVRIYLALGEPEKALTLLDDLMTAEADSVESEVLQGFWGAEAWLALGDPVQARQWLEMAQKPIEAYGVTRLFPRLDTLTARLGG